MRRTGVIAVGCHEQGLSGGHMDSMAVGRLSKRELQGPPVLLVVHIAVQVLLQRGAGPFPLAFSYRVRIVALEGIEHK